MVNAVNRGVSQSGSSYPHAGGQALRFRNRRSDPPVTFFRSSRYFTVGHEWYVTTREGRNLGPFSTRDEAELAGVEQVARHYLVSHGGVAKLYDHDEDGVTEFELMVREMLAGLEQHQLRSENIAFVWTTQRIDELERYPDKQTHTAARIKALEYLLDQWGG